MSDQFIGEIRNFAFSFPPYGWAQCQGQLLPISQNQALFSLLGTTYGGNGSTNFGLPDLRGRAPIGLGQGPGLTLIDQGEMAGAEQVTLTIPQMPQHTHAATFTPSGGGGTPAVNVTVQGSSATGGTTAPTGNYIAGLSAGGTARTGQNFVSNPATNTLGPIAGVAATISGVSGGGGTVANAVTGSSLPVPIRDPYLGSNYCIALSGIFPSRN